MPAFVIFHFTGSFVTYTCNAFNAYPRLNDSFLLASRVDRSLRKFMKARENEYIYIYIFRIPEMFKKRKSSSKDSYLTFTPRFVYATREREREI